MAEEREKKELVDNSGGRRRKCWIFLLLLIMLLLVLLLMFLLRRPDMSDVKYSAAGPDSDGTADTMQVAVDSLPPVDTVLPDTAVDGTADEDTVTVPPVKKKEPEKATSETDTLITPDTATAADSADTTALQVEDTVDTVVSEDSCGADTTALWVYPDPSGGLHYRQVEVRFVANRPATVHYKLKGEKKWKRYSGDPITISSTATLLFDAIDSCGKVMERREEYYEIAERERSPCSAGMEQVKVGTMNFCIDRYEWPNRKGVIPRSFISVYQAMDSCFSVEKRLCTAEEWAVACGGPYSYAYPYGDTYEPYGCSTHDTLVLPSGSKPECRTFFGVFDMSGNLLEWTSTRAKENSSFYYVAGGFWESGPKSGCHSRRYSYFPQNRHNPVGFRCCTNIPTPEVSGKRRR